MPVRRKIEYTIFVVVEGRDFIAFGVYGHAKVDAFRRSLVVSDDGIPDVETSQSSRTVGAEIEHRGAVGQISNGGMSAAVAVEIYLATHFLCFLPFAFIEVGYINLARYVREVVGLADSEVDVLM